MPGRHIGEHRNSSTIPDLGTRWRWLVSLVPLVPCTRGNGYRHQFIMMLCGPQSRSGCHTKGQKLVLTGNGSQSVQPISVTTVTDNAVIIGNINNSLFSLYKTYSAPSLIQPFASFSHKHITMAQNCAAVYHLHSYIPQAHYRTGDYVACLKLTCLTPECPWANHITSHNPKDTKFSRAHELYRQNCQHCGSFSELQTDTFYIKHCNNCFVLQLLPSGPSESICHKALQGCSRHICFQCTH
jgi:hypothetical protein